MQSQSKPTIVAKVAKAPKKLSEYEGKMKSLNVLKQHPMAQNLEQWFAIEKLAAGLKSVKNWSALKKTKVIDDKIAKAKVQNKQLEDFLIKTIIGGQKLPNPLARELANFY